MKVESFEILEIRLAVSTKGAVQKQHFEFFTLVEFPKMALI